MVQVLSIKSKLILAILALVASVALMGMTADDAHAGVTEIRNVYNNTGKTVYLWNHENGYRVTIAPGQQVLINNWVPWCTGYTDFNRGHFIEVGYVNGGSHVYKYSIWQQNRNGLDRIRYTAITPMNYSPTAQAMPGASSVDGRRDLVLFDLDQPATTTSSGVRLNYS